MSDSSTYSIRIAPSSVGALGVYWRCETCSSADGVVGGRRTIGEIRRRLFPDVDIVMDPDVIDWSIVERTAREEVEAEVAAHVAEVHGRRCECEHVDHETGGAHPYGAAAAVESFATPWGTFARCGACRDAGHMNPESYLAPREVVVSPLAEALLGILAESSSRGLRQCPECGRLFNMTNETHVAEWSAGHDCEPRTVGELTVTHRAECDRSHTGHASPCNTNLAGGRS